MRAFLLCALALSNLASASTPAPFSLWKRLQADFFSHNMAHVRTSHDARLVTIASGDRYIMSLLNTDDLSVGCTTPPSTSTPSFAVARHAEHDEIWLGVRNFSERSLVIMNPSNCEITFERLGITHSSFADFNGDNELELFGIDSSNIVVQDRDGNVLMTLEDVLPNGTFHVLPGAFGGTPGDDLAVMSTTGGSIYDGQSGVLLNQFELTQPIERVSAAIDFFGNGTDHLVYAHEFSVHAIDPISEQALFSLGSAGELNSIKPLYHPQQPAAKAALHYDDRTTIVDQSGSVGPVYGGTFNAATMLDDDSIALLASKSVQVVDLITGQVSKTHDLHGAAVMLSEVADLDGDGQLEFVAYPNREDHNQRAELLISEKGHVLADLKISNDTTVAAMIGNIDADTHPELCIVREAFGGDTRLDCEDLVTQSEQFTTSIDILVKDMSLTHSAATTPQIVVAGYGTLQFYEANNGWLNNQTPPFQSIASYTSFEDRTFVVSGFGFDQRDFIELDSTTASVIENHGVLGISAVSTTDTKLYAGYANGLICQIDNTGGSPLCKLNSVGGPVEAFSVSPDESRLVVIRRFQNLAHNEILYIDGMSGEVLFSSSPAQYQSARALDRGRFLTADMDFLTLWQEDRFFAGGFE